MVQNGNRSNNPEEIDLLLSSGILSYTRSKKLSLSPYFLPSLTSSQVLESKSPVDEILLISSEIILKQNPILPEHQLLKSLSLIEEYLFHFGLEDNEIDSLLL